MNTARQQPVITQDNNPNVGFGEWGIPQFILQKIVSK